MLNWKISVNRAKKKKKTLSNGKSKMHHRLATAIPIAFFFSLSFRSMMLLMLFSAANAPLTWPIILQCGFGRGIPNGNSSWFFSSSSEKSHSFLSSLSVKMHSPGCPPPPADFGNKRQHYKSIFYLWSERIYYWNISSLSFHFTGFELCVRCVLVSWSGKGLSRCCAGCSCVKN